MDQNNSATPQDAAPIQQGEKRSKKSIWIIAGVLVVIAVFVVIALVSAYNNAKQIPPLAQSAQAHLETAKTRILDEKNFADGQTEVEEAIDLLGQAQDKLHKTTALRILPLYNRQYKAADALMTDGIGTLSEGVQLLQIAANLYSELDLENREVIDFGREDNRKIIATVIDSMDPIKAFSKNLNSLVGTLEDIRDDEKVFEQMRSIAVSQIPALSQANDILLHLIDVEDFIGVATGYPEEQNYLFLIQNNRELRPTGGHIGHATVLSVDSAEVERVKIDNVYKPNAELTQDAPAPVVEYLGAEKLGIRNANWSPDFPTTARNIISVYKEQVGYTGELNGVVALSPDAIARLLKATGPITVRNTTFTPENFVEELEFVGNDMSESVRNDLINDFAVALLDEIQKVNIAQFVTTYDELREISLAQKDILVYHTDPSIQAALQAKDWAGQIKSSSGDYLMVVDSNMNALKTDSVIDRKIMYSVREENNGLVARVQVDYNHTSPANAKVTDYKSYTRILAPQGSQLISSEGFQSDITSGVEAGKAVFGGYFEVATQSSHSIVVEYRLPSSVSSNNEYKLFVQKQPGVINPIEYNLEFNEDIDEYEPESLNVMSSEDNIFKATDLINTDKQLMLEF